MSESTMKRRQVKRIAKRSLRWSAPWLTLTLAYTDGKSEATVYRVEERPSDAGRSFDLFRLLRKGERSEDAHGLRTYRVDLCGDGRQSCNCKGFVVSGQSCKHTDACRKVVELEGTGYPGGEPEVEPTDDVTACY